MRVPSFGREAVIIVALSEVILAADIGGYQLFVHPYLVRLCQSEESRRAAAGTEEARRTRSIDLVIARVPHAVSSV